MKSIAIVKSLIIVHFRCMQGPWYVSMKRDISKQSDLKPGTITRTGEPRPRTHLIRETQDPRFYFTWGLSFQNWKGDPGPRTLIMSENLDPEESYQSCCFLEETFQFLGNLLFLVSSF